MTEEKQDDITFDEVIAYNIADEWLRKDASVFAFPDVWDKAVEHVCAHSELGAQQETISAVFSGVAALRASGDWIDRTEGETACDTGRSGISLLPACEALRARAALGPEQGTEDWLRARRQFFTATDVEKILGTTAARNSVMFSKCESDVGPGFAGGFLGGARGHGTKYEPLSARLYELAFGVSVVPLNYVVHPTVKYLAASPDGLVMPGPVDGRGDAFRVGRLVEFKNPTSGNRGELDAEPKRAWWIQMQTQMEVCDVEEVDFVATVFKEVSMDALLDKDLGGRAPARGAVVHIGRASLVVVKLDENGLGPVSDGAESLPDSMYRYQDPILFDETMGPDQIRECIRSFVLSVLEEFEPKGFQHVSTTYWYLEDMCCNLVPRNRAWFATVLPSLNETRAQVEKERVTGEWRQRAPKRRTVVEIESAW